MQILQIILAVMIIVAYAAMTFFACFAFFRLKRLGDQLRGINKATHSTLMLMAGEHIRKSLEEIGRMRSDLDDLVAAEQYEQAEKLKALIIKSEKDVQENIQHMNELFGDVIKIENVSVKRTKEL